MKKFRFFFHYRRDTQGMSIHFMKKCYPVEEVICEVPCETHRQKVQPRLVMRGFCKEIVIKDNIGYIK